MGVLYIQTENGVEAVGGGGVKLPVCVTDVAVAEGNNLEVTFSNDTAQVYALPEPDVGEVATEVIKRITGGNILPDTRIAEDSGAGEWDYLEAAYLLDLPLPLVVGNKYVVTIDGVSHTVTAAEAKENGLVTDGVVLPLTDISIFYEEGGTDYSETFNALISVDKKYQGEITNEEGRIPLIPFVLRIDGEGSVELGRVEIVATMADGTTKTLRLLGGVV